MAIKKLLLTLTIFFILTTTAIVAILAYNWKIQQGEEKEEIKLILSPSSFNIEEGSRINLTLYVEYNGEPYVTKANWSVESSGNTGEILPYGNGKAIYIAPRDVNELEHHVRITAKVGINGEIYCISSNGTIYPELHNTSITIKSNRKSMIAGEKCLLRANLMAYVDRWMPLGNKSVRWIFYRDGKIIGEKMSKTDRYGYAETYFGISNLNENASVEAVVKFNMDLSGEIDYRGCSAKTVFKIRPEKPGDFPVVLIHGWSGSVSESFLNFTWWNLTKKLEERGFKVLDFDVRKGIQWLSYKPEWFGEHHIPWIAGKVSQKIRDVLVQNGYPPNQTIDIVAHSMGGLVARFMAEHYMADVDFWNDSWKPGDEGFPWYGDGIGDVVIGGWQIDDLIVVGTPCHGIPPNINESILQIINYVGFPWWIAQVPDMIYNSPFLEAMGYRTSDLVDYYAIGGDIGFIFGDYSVDFDGDGIPHTSDGLCPTESPYLEGRPLYILEGKPWPFGEEDHLSLIAKNEKVHEYIIQHLIN